MSKLSGKVAVVTGASKGIGAEIARALAAEGASVVVNYASSREGADKVVADIVAKGGKATAVRGDVSKSDDVEALFAETRTTFGAADILVNNAGIYAFGTIEDFAEEEFHRQFNTNVLGLLLTTKAAVKQFGSGGGSIINVGSAITRLNPPAAAIYTATKSGVDAITRVLSKELGSRKIRVNSINPGGVNTEGSRSGGIIGSDLETNMVQQTPLGRIGRPDDIAPLAVFLASDDAKWVTGEVVVASGGM